MGTISTNRRGGEGVNTTIPKMQCILHDTSIEFVSSPLGPMGYFCPKCKAKFEEARIVYDSQESAKAYAMQTVDKLARERDKLLALLAKERDEFGKRETELRAKLARLEGWIKNREHEADCFILKLSGYDLVCQCGLDEALADSGKE